MGESFRQLDNLILRRLERKRGCVAMNDLDRLRIRPSVRLQGRKEHVGIDLVASIRDCELKNVSPIIRGLRFIFCSKDICDWV